MIGIRGPASAEALASGADSSWPVVPLGSAELTVGDLADVATLCDVVCVDAELALPRLMTIYARGRTRAPYEWPPVVVLEKHIWPGRRIVRRPWNTLFVSSPKKAPLQSRMVEASFSPLFHDLALQALDEYADHPMLGTALQVALGERLPSMRATLGLPGEGSKHRERINTVRALAGATGCSESLLYDLAREAAVSLGTVLSRSRLLRALTTYAPATSWTTIAWRAGYQGLSGLANGVQRHWHRRLTECEQQCVGELATRLSQALGCAEGGVGVARR